MKSGGINRGFLRLVLQRRPNSDLYFLLVCQTLAVAMVTGILLFSSGIEQLIYRESAQMMAADTIVESSRPIPEPWRARLENDNAIAANEIAEVRSARFMSMLFSGESMQLTNIRAVTHGYPLRGELTAADTVNAEPVVQPDSPPRGQIWLDETAIRLLDLAPGEEVELGEISLSVGKVLHDEPGSALPGIGFSGRALMHFDDLSGSGLVQPGSRVSYEWMLAGPAAELDRFSRWLGESLSEHDSIVSHRDGDERTQEILERVRSYISLGSVMAVLLTGIAAMMTAARYMAGQQDRVAIMRALGAGRSSLLAYYLLQFGAYSLASLLLGYLVGFVAQALVFEWLGDWVEIPVVLDPRAFIAGAVTTVFCLLCFALPTVLGLLKTSPMRLLRAESANASQLRGILLFAAGFLLLMVYYSGSWQITLWVYGGVLLLATAVWIAMRLLVLCMRMIAESRWARSMPLAVLMGLQSFCRQTQQVQLRTVLLASTVALLATTWIVRTGLLDDWQSQLPEDAPNFFALDIPPDLADRFTSLLSEQSIRSEPLYPVSRARLVAFNGMDAGTFGIRDAEALSSLDREMVLTESKELPPGNEIVTGSWHGDQIEDTGQNGLLRVSMEAEYAGELGVTTGDRLSFSFAGQQQEFVVSSLRALDWNSMQPNFYFVLEPPGVSNMPYSFMTSFRVAEESRVAMDKIAREVPGMTLIDIGQIVERVTAILQRVSLAVESIAGLTVIAGVLVVVASLRMSLAVRMQEFCIMRALGASQRTLAGSLVAELVITGLVAALSGMLTATVLVSGLGRAIFDLQLLLPPVLWVELPGLLIVIVAATGLWVLRPVLVVSPVQLWRTAL